MCIFSQFILPLDKLLVVNKNVEVLLQEDAYLEEWSEWSQCSITCIGENSKDFGTRTRTAKCIEGKNKGQTCLELIGNSNKIKVMEATCAGVIGPCPIDHYYLDWTPWSDCPKCVKTAESNPKCKRTRRCIDGKHGGSECPSIVR